jgi:hypothetical protein
VIKKKASITDLLNDMTYSVTYNRFKNLALNIFEWTGLPENMKPEYIEKTLFEHGQALFVNDSALGFLCLKCLVDGGFNVYGEPVKFRAVGLNYNKQYDIDNSVLIKNNPLKVPTDYFITIYANKLTEIERTMDVNVKAVKTPYIVTCDEKDLLTFKNIFKMVDGNVPAIYADKNLNINAIQVLQTGVEFLCDKLADYRHDVTNEVLTFLGINNANTDKRERLISDEVNANNAYVDENISYMLESRQQACEQINAMYGLNISVDVKHKEEPREGGNEDGTIHGGAENDN